MTRLRRFTQWTVAGAFLALAMLVLMPSEVWSKAVGMTGTVVVNQGGTGATSLTDGGILLGSGTGAVTAAAVLASGEVLVGDGTTDPAAQTLSGDVTMAASGAVTIAENAVDADMLGAMTDKIVLCGQLIDADSVQTWVGPAAAAYLGGGAEHAIGGTVCNALDSETSSAAADAAIDAGFPAFKVSGLQCIISAAPTNPVAIVVHSAAAVLTPTVTCTIAGAATGCSTVVASTTDVAAGATISLEVNYTEDLDTDDIWCQLYFALK